MPNVMAARCWIKTLVQFVAVLNQSSPN